MEESEEQRDVEALCRQAVGIAAPIALQQANAVPLRELADLDRELIEVYGAQPAVGGHLQVRQAFGVQVPISFGHIGVDSHGIGSGDHGLLEGHVFQVAAGGAVAQQDAVAVYQGNRGQHEAGQVGQALVNLLVQAVALSAQNAVPVLHAKGNAGEFVLLGDGQVEDLVGFKKRPKDGPILEHDAIYVHLAEELGIGKDHFSALGAGRSLNARALKAAAGLVATDVGDDDPLGSRLPALTDDLGDDFGIGVGGLLQGAIPGDVGLENHHILAADEAADAAQVFKR